MYAQGQFGYRELSKLTGAGEADERGTSTVDELTLSGVGVEKLLFC